MRGPEKKSFWGKGEAPKTFLHDEETFGKLWGDVEKITGTKGKWTVQSRFRERPIGASDGDGSTRGMAFFTGKGIGWITFSVERRRV